MGISILHSVSAAIALLILGAGMTYGQPLAAAEQRDEAASESHDSASLHVSWNHSGPLKPGDVVEISAQGFPPFHAVEIGAGPPHSEYTVWAEGQSSAQGTVQAEVTIPPSVPDDIDLVFVVSTEDFSVVARSHPLGLSNSPTPTQNRNRDLISQVSAVPVPGV